MAGRAMPRWLTIAAAASFALLAIGNGLDRASAADPALARLAPDLLAAESHRAAAARALESGQTDTAVANAAAAVRADPVDPRSAALLGAASLASNRPVAADRAFRVAARFGWRDPLTQVYFMNAALAGGQPHLAALRLDAVLRQAPNLPLRDMLLARFEGSPEGRAALAKRLALRPPWTPQFLGDRASLPLPVLQSRAAIVAGLAGPRWGCDAVAPLVDRLVNAGGTLAAKDLWRAHCPAAAAGIADPHFRHIPGDRTATAFEWNLIGSGDLAVNPAASPRHGLLARTSGPASLPAAWQMLVLSPGRRELAWTALDEGGSPATALSLSLSCTLGDPRPVESRPAGPPGRFVADLTIDGACAGQFLTVWLAPGHGEVRFDDAEISPIR